LLYSPHLIYFDAWHDTLARQAVHKGSAVCCCLLQRLLEHDGTADTSLTNRGSVEQLTVRTAGFLQAAVAVAVAAD
jgi:hypothetical protein